ncbi:AhpC/TSA family protein [Parapedobacter koreensis]|uniref:AhpC/TSA family protein n=2 Tax=Parapedobacter koreensis TaxID=332977 RepID=A0A1H7TQG5_9SPHI|nr:AhpC/TSA family protein [Parapedobacter koreensis]
MITFTGMLLLLSMASCENSAKSTQAQEPHASSLASTPSVGEEPTAAAPQPAASQPAQTIPDFAFYILRSGIRFTKQDLAKKGNIVFILFDPTCSHCQHEANHIGQHYDEVKDANFYFVSMNDPALMSTFLETHAKPLVGKANVELLYDRNADFINKFHIPSQYPAVYVYGNNGQLKDHWDGERDIDKVVASIRN